MASETPVPAKKSNASRYLFLFLLGLVVGVIASVMALNYWNKGKDHFPESVMFVMAKHKGMLGKTIEQNRCAATDTVPHIRTLRAMANDLETAFPDLAENQRFSAHTSKYRADLDAMLTTPPTDCPSAQAAFKTIDTSCDSCHQDFRN